MAGQKRAISAYSDFHVFRESRLTGDRDACLAGEIRYKIIVSHPADHPADHPA